MKLLRIANVRDDLLGGMSRTMHFTGTHLRELGFHVDYVFADRFRWNLSRGLRRFTDGWEARTIVESIGAAYDIVEIHEPLSLGCALWRRWRPRSAKLVAFSYGLEHRGRAAMLAYKKKNGLHMPIKGRVTSYVQAKQSLLGLRYVDHVVCSSGEDVEELQSRGFNSLRLTRHFSGIETELIERGSTCENRGNGKILFLGTWIERKGCNEITAAMTNVLSDYPDASLTIAGCRLCAEFVLSLFPEKVRKQIEVIPAICDERVLYKVYAEHSILLLPSYFEGFPLVLTEAAAFGMAVITTNICGMRDFVRDSENGLLVQAGDTHELETAICQLLNNPKLIATLGQNARSDATKLTWRSAAENLAKSYESLVT